VDLTRQHKTVHLANPHLVNPLQQVSVVVQHLFLVVAILHHFLVLNLQVLLQVAYLAILQRHQHLDSQLILNHPLEVTIYELFHLHV